MKFSASQLKMWGTCSLQAKYHYVDNMYRFSTGSSAHMGSAVHKALEEYLHGADFDSTIKAFEEYYDDPQNTPDYINTNTTFMGLRKKGLSMLEDYLEEQKWQLDIVTLGSEKNFMVPFGNHTISGIIDHLYTNTTYSKLFIKDFKTGSRPKAEQLYLDIQGTTYHWAVRQKEFWTGYDKGTEADLLKYPGFENGEELWETFRDAEIELIWHDLKNAKEYTFGDRGDRDYARMYRLVQMIDRAVETDTFVPTISADGCTWCSYQDICPVYFEENLTSSETSVSI